MNLDFLGEMEAEYEAKLKKKKLLLEQGIELNSDDEDDAILNVEVSNPV